MHDGIGGCILYRLRLGRVAREARRARREALEKKAEAERRRQQRVRDAALIDDQNYLSRREPELPKVQQMSSLFLCVPPVLDSAHAPWVC
jgi:hypothetical protein